MSPAMHRYTPRAHRRQSGIILVTSLLLLLVLTVLGIAMMKMTNMQERMAGNTRDLNLALQGSEAGLRDAENKVRLLTQLPILSANLNCEYCEKLVLPVDLDDPSAFDWAANGWEFGTAGTQEIGQLDEDPRYKIEEFTVVLDGPSQGTNDDGSGRDFFAVTARSTGATGRTNTVLQTTYARRFQ